MSLTEGGQEVLKAILSIGIDRSLSIGRRMRVPTPGTDDFYALCNLLACDPEEEDLQKFLEDRPGFITGLLGGPDNVDLAVIYKPKIGTKFIADFCVLQAHQGGAVAQLIEIESAHEPLFTNEGRTAKRLSGAATQIEDWRIWIDGASTHYAKELVQAAQNLPPLDNFRKGDRGFRLYDEEQLEASWKAFGGLDVPIYSFSIIIGRWSKLNSGEKARLLNRNRNGSPGVRVYTYEQLARGANFRLERDDWFNQDDQWGPINQPIDISDL